MLLLDDAFEGSTVTVGLTAAISAAVGASGGVRRMGAPAVAAADGSPQG